MYMLAHTRHVQAFGFCPANQLQETKVTYMNSGSHCHRQYNAVTAWQLCCGKVGRTQCTANSSQISDRQSPAKGTMHAPLQQSLCRNRLCTRQSFVSGLKVWYACMPAQHARLCMRISHMQKCTCAVRRCLPGRVY